MVSAVPNSIQLVMLAVGFLLARSGLVTEARLGWTTEFAWPRVVTRLTRTPKDAVDVAMVGLAVGSTAIAGVGITGPFEG